MTENVMPYSRHSRKTNSRKSSRKSANVTSNGSSPLVVHQETTLTLLSRTGERRERDDQEVIDLIEEDEEVNSEDSDSEDEDQVTETEQAKSKRGKAPVFHHEIYDRLVKLMSKQGAYSISPPYWKNALTE